MNRRLIVAIVAVMTLVMAIALVGCGDISTAEAKYWFSDYAKENVAYSDADGGNLDEAGTYWRMRVKKDMNVDLVFNADVDDMYTSMAFTINGEKVLRDRHDMFNVAYKGLALKKGDELVFHAFAINSIKAEEHNDGYNISFFQVVLDGANYIVEDIK